MKNNYNDFIKNKIKSIEYLGIEIDRKEIHSILFEYQKDLVKWALKKGKSALFTMTGTGKTLIELEFCRQLWIKKRYSSIIITPLAVSEQTIREAKNKLNIKVNNLRKNSFREGINIVNYEYLHKINSDNYKVVVLDESGILKDYSGKIRNNIITIFKDFRFKLAASATPAPNDYEELGNHSEFLDVLKRKEMLAMYFNHDSSNTSKWKLKKHAFDKYWEWVSSWASVMNNPSDLGYNEDRFNLPLLNEKIITLKLDFTNYKKRGYFVPCDQEMKTLSDRRKARRESLPLKIKWIKEKIKNQKDNIFLIWCDLNYESEALKKAIPYAVEIRGSNTNEYKEKNMLDFAEGKIKVLITKPKIAGHGMNWQICYNQIFCGLSDSFESYFQAVRRSWRFGQEREVNIFVVSSNLEKVTIDNIKRKEIEFNRMYDAMKNNTIKYVIQNLKNENKNLYKPNKIMILPEWLKG